MPQSVMNQKGKMMIRQKATIMAQVVDPELKQQHDKR